jgi:hypothetical protein
VLLATTRHGSQHWAAVLPFRSPKRSNQSIRTTRVQSHSGSVRESRGVADNLVGLDRINGGKVHGPVWEGSFLNRVTANRHHSSVPFVDQYTSVCAIDAMRFPLEHLKKRCSEEEERSGDLKFRVFGANRLEKFRNIMFAEIGRNLARVDQLNEQRQRPPSSFITCTLPSRQLTFRDVVDIFAERNSQQPERQRQILNRYLKNRAQSLIPSPIG